MHFFKMNVFKTHSRESQKRQEVGIYQNRVKSFSQGFLALFSDLNYLFPMQNYVVFFCFFWRGIPCRKAILVRFLRFSPKSSFAYCRKLVFWLLFSQNSSQKPENWQGGIFSQDLTFLDVFLTILFHHGFFIQISYFYNAF